MYVWDDATVDQLVCYFYTTFVEVIWKGVLICIDWAFYWDIYVFFILLYFCNYVYGD